MHEFETALEQLEAYDGPTKKHGLQTFSSAGDKAKDYAEDIAKLLEDEEADVRVAAAKSLGKVNCTKQANNLVYALKDDDKLVRAEAARSLGLLGRDACIKHAEKIAALVKDPAEEPQTAAVECLAAIGEAPRLAPFFSSSFPAVARIAIIDVGRSKDARDMHAQLIADKIGHKDIHVRLAAVQASGELGPDCTEPHLAALGALRTTEQRHVKIRQAAVQSIGKAGNAGISHLLNYFRDNDEAIRHQAAETLGSVVGGEAAAAAAAEMLTESSAEVRRAALQALSRLGDHGRNHKSTISEHIEDSDLPSRLAAIQALNDLHPESEADKLGSLFADPNKGVRQAAVMALAKMDLPGAEQAQRFLDDEDQAIRQTAVKVFSPLHTKLSKDIARKYSEAVACKLLDEDWRVRFAAVVALGDLYATEFSQQVAALCHDDNGQVRRTAVTALQKMGTNPAYVAAFLGDEDPGVRAEAQRAYDALGGANIDDGELSECD